MKVKQYLLDSTVAVVFWVPLAGLWNEFVSGISGTQLLYTLAGAAVLNLAFGGIFAKTLRGWQKKLRYKE